METHHKRTKRLIPRGHKGAKGAKGATNTPRKGLTV